MSREGLTLPNYFIRIVIDNLLDGPNRIEVSTDSIKLSDSIRNYYNPICAIHGEILKSIPFNYSGTISVTKSLTNSNRPKVTLTMTKDKGKTNWTLYFNSKGPCKFTLFFFLPEGSKPDKLHWPGLEPFDLSQLKK